jgi:tetratricopeptide (TPR) repeat protein
MPLEVRVRFGLWDEVLAQPDYPDHLPLARALRHAARAVAHAAKKELPQARAEQAQFLRAHLSPDATFGNNSAAALLSVASHLTAGEVAFHEGRTEAGLDELRQAVRAEDQLRYDEPPDWLLPARHALGAALLRAGRAADAEAVYRDDLSHLPDNGWSLWGLGRALEQQRKDASTLRARFREIWRDGDVELSSSCLCIPGV